MEVREHPRCVTPRLPTALRNLLYTWMGGWCCCRGSPRDAGAVTAAVGEITVASLPSVLDCDDFSAAACSGWIHPPNTRTLLNP